MSKEVYNEGDLVEAVKGRTVLRAPLVKSEHTGALHMGQITGLVTVGELTHYGYTVTVIEKAKPPVVLPTEVGCYESADFPLATGHEPYRLSLAGEWWLGSTTVTERYMADRLPLIRLAPVAEVLEKVRVRYDNFSESFNDNVASVAASYGVTL